MWVRSAAIGAVVAAVLGMPVTSASAVRHLSQFNSPDRTIWCVGVGASAVGGAGSEGCFATLTPLATTTEYAGFFTSTGELQTCAAAPPFNLSHHCMENFVTSAPVLAFGETNEIEGFRCASASDGVTCTKVAGAGAGKGFRINAHEVVRVGSASSGSSPAPAKRSCGTERVQPGTIGPPKTGLTSGAGIPYKIIVWRGSVSCRKARSLIKATGEGKGTWNGARSVAGIYTTFPGGWRCALATGGGYGCWRGRRIGASGHADEIDGIQL